MNSTTTVSNLEVCSYLSGHIEPRKWDGTFTKAVRNMQTRHISCPNDVGADKSNIEKAIFGDVTISKWGASILCKFATTGSPKIWDFDYPAAVVEAKERGLQCDVRHDNATNVTDKYVTWTNFDVCFRATIGRSQKRWAWHNRDAIIEAKSRGLDCGTGDPV